MQKRCLGKTDIEVSVLGLGAVKFGRNKGVKYPAAFELPSDQVLENLIAKASQFGINLIDTAPAYGTSEERIGKLLKNKRHQWVLSTKVGEEYINGVSQFDFSRLAILNSIERSLKRLQTDYLDIVLVHSDGDDIKLIEQDQVFVTLADLKQSGKVRAFGMSTKTIAGGLATLEHADVAMVTYNLLDQKEHEVIVKAQQLQKGILIKKALASGHLPKFNSKHSFYDSLHFILKEKGVSSVIVGTINVEHLQENVEALIEKF